MVDFRYPGSELDIFAHASNWKSYWSSKIRRFLAGDLLEVGAGIGSNTELLMAPSVRRLVCLEPDRNLARELEASIGPRSTGGKCEVVVGTLDALSGTTRRFDAILYIDVLEHIADDRGELSRAAELLASNGRLIVLAPAHQWLYSEFDRAIGHFRRYTKESLSAAAPEHLIPEWLIYLDSAGLLASLQNRLVLKQRQPTDWQIQVWDRLLVPCSRMLDRIVGHRLGKSVLAVWRRNDA